MEGRQVIARALDEDLHKLSDARAQIDAAVAGHVERFAEGRQQIAAMLESDLAGKEKLAENGGQS